MFVSASPFDIHAFIDEVFAPQAGERVLLLVDEPTAQHPLNADWEARHALADEWHGAFAELGEKRGFEVLPILRFPAAAAHHAPFPEHGTLDGRRVPVDDTLDEVSLAIGMNEVSMTSGLAMASMRRPGAASFRAASAPLLRKDMEDACLAIDYAALRDRCAVLEALIQGAVAADVEFATGDRCRFDLRHRRPGVDNGYLRRDKEGIPLINLPSGEVWITPYEGEIAGDVPRTEGVIPVALDDGSVASFRVEANRVVAVEGENPARDHYRRIFDVDPMRRNVGEIAFGCNPGARVSGLYIEDEKAGFHWGFGRSDFLGGTVGPAHFLNEATVMHIDNPYARDCPITVSADLIDTAGRRTAVLQAGNYVI